MIELNVPFIQEGESIVSLQAIEVSQSPEEKFREYLATRSKPQRFTEQQKELVSFIFSKHHHFDPDQLIDDLKAAKRSISRATIYRTLAKLVDAGLLRRIDLGKRTVFEHDYGYPHHEHLVCETCGKMIEFQHGSLEQILLEVASEHAFQASGYTLLVRGKCVECNRARTNKRRLDLI
jgi:Fur family transcriptional regulator, ferric uptake regulator